MRNPYYTQSTDLNNQRFNRQSPNNDDRQVARIKLILDKPWQSDFKDESSEQYIKFDRTLRNEIGNIFANFPGQNIPTVVKFENPSNSGTTETLGTYGFNKNIKRYNFWSQVF